MTPPEAAGTAEAPAVGTSDPGAKLAARRIRVEPYGMELGPLAHLAPERQRLQALTWNEFDVRQWGATLGAEISGIDLSVELPEPVIAELRRALLEYKIIFFRDQPLTSARHVAFARRFGELEVHPFITGNPDHPELVRFEKGADVAGYENGWHHDVTWREVPSMGAILHAISVPSTGGDTLFADMAAAYDGLDDETKARVEGLYAIHDFLLAFRSQVPEGAEEATRAAYPPARHPVIRTHPETGRRIIFVNRFFTSHIEGVDPDESVELIGHLSSQAETVEYQFRLHWEPHTVAFWDNRTVQHYAANDYWPDVRVMERASIVGDRPV